MHTNLERLLSKSLTTLKVMAYYLVVHTGPEWCISSMIYNRDIPFWSEILEMLLTSVRFYKDYAYVR